MAFLSVNRYEEMVREMNPTEIINEFQSVCEDECKGRSPLITGLKMPIIKKELKSRIRR